jgi:hypothetical protein
LSSPGAARPSQERTPHRCPCIHPLRQAQHARRGLRASRDARICTTHARVRETDRERRPGGTRSSRDERRRSRLGRPLDEAVARPAGLRGRLLGPARTRGPRHRVATTRQAIDVAKRQQAPPHARLPERRQTRRQTRSAARSASSCSSRAGLRVPEETPMTCNDWRLELRRRCSIPRDRGFWAGQFDFRWHGSNVKPRLKQRGHPVSAMRGTGGQRWWPVRS